MGMAGTSDLTQILSLIEARSENKTFKHQHLKFKEKKSARSSPFPVSKQTSHKETHVCILTYTPSHTTAHKSLNLLGRIDWN